jgi:putative endonuclease
MRAHGDRAEEAAAIFLQQQGLIITGRNYHCRFGEIDLIARDGITPSKQAKLLRTARYYLSGCRQLPVCRFDAVLIIGSHRPEWLKNVFGE